MRIWVVNSALSLRTWWVVSLHHLLVELVLLAEVRWLVMQLLLLTLR
jgi:hypothetical protein